MLANYLLNAEVTSVDRDVNEAVPDYAWLLRAGRMVPSGDSRQPILKTHFLPETDVMQEYRDLTGKVVCLVRNPRDVILSSARMLEIPQANTAAFVKDFIANRGVRFWIDNGWGTWQQSVREWASEAAVRRHFPCAEVLTVRYEDMRADPAACLERIVGFLELGGSGEAGRVERAARNSSLAKMRGIERADRTSGVNAFVGVEHNPFVGKGLTNQSLSGLGADIESAYRQWLREDEEFRLCVSQFGYEV